jgi:hypothetical protein
MDLSRKLKRLFSQPRIPGVTRDPRHTALVPELSAWLISRAGQRGISVSRAAAEILGERARIDAASGKRIVRAKRIVMKVKGGKV